ncbi:hypothetical protein ACIA78_11340 [Streptomyces xanthochromogenes]|uniref:hypothetical protein n=1 Tax=Streptomyces xanthochromogenes TaxID=67384 RepID=UPI0037B1AFC7
MIEPDIIARSAPGFTVHMEQFAPVPVTLPWNASTPAEMPVKAKHRRPRTYSLLATGRERKAINRNYFNSYVWKPALAAAGVIAALDEGSAESARVGEPSRKRGCRRTPPWPAEERCRRGAAASWYQMSRKISICAPTELRRSARSS